MKRDGRAKPFYARITVKGGGRVESTHYATALEAGEAFLRLKVWRDRS
jgi:hypothetical protein